jgi:hypothetical protein
MEWDYLKENLYHWDGSWRDIYIKDTSKDDWEKWISFVNEYYRIEWYNPITDILETKIDFKVIKDIFEGNSEYVTTANVFIEDIQINAHFFTANEIENDIDPREFNSKDDHFKLMNYLKAISKLLRKQVILTPENSNEIILLTVNLDEIVISNDISPGSWPINIRN